MSAPETVPVTDVEALRQQLLAAMDESYLSQLFPVALKKFRSAVALVDAADLMNLRNRDFLDMDEVISLLKQPTGIIHALEILEGLLRQMRMALMQAEASKVKVE